MLQSPPSRRRGLKYANAATVKAKVDVASFSEAWIEMTFDPETGTITASRLLLGGVD